MYMVVLFQYTCPFKHGGPTWVSCRTHFTNLIWLYFYPKILVCIFAPSVCTNSCIIFIRTYHYFKMEYVTDYVVSSPSFNSFKHNHSCNRVHRLLATTICVSLLHFQQTYAFRRKKDMATLSNSNAREKY